MSMSTSERDRWWVALTAALGTLLLVGAAFLALTGADESSFAIVGAVSSTISGGLVLGGLARQRADVITGSWLILTGAALTIAGGLELIPVGIVVAVSGLWTGNLQLSASADVPDLMPATRQQVAMTRTWWLWLAVAVALFAVGWLPLIFDDPDDLTTGGWAVWILSWLAAAITAGIGLLLGGLRLVVRHRTRLA